MVRCIHIRFFKICSAWTSCRLRNVVLFATITATVWFFKRLTWTLILKTNSFPPNEFRTLIQTMTTTRSTFNLKTSQQSFSSFLATPSPIPPFPPSTEKFPFSSNAITSVEGPYLSQKDPMQGNLGQGNLMFMYAALLGIAHQANMTPVYPTLGSLRNIFTITASSLSPLRSNSIQEDKACSFDSKLFSMADRHRNVTVVGYLQSWKYFSAIEGRIRQEFTFNEKLRMQAQEFLRTISQTRNISIRFNETLYIGVHIRRQDMLAKYNIARGYVAATKEYLVKAVEFFKSEFSGKLLAFVICSDDPLWSKQNFPHIANSDIIVFSENRTAAQDMSILASCNHTIITVGTFGWWAAYLTGGRTVYYKNFPASGTFIDGILNKNDYFPPNWIAMS